ncbi:MAG: hypothetical protein IEMM0006_1106 [bacterium]|nr:MAG: hypothetical protein IEMM0006_1106 [bacterium]
MEKIFARVLSIIFHPLLVPTWFLLILFKLPFYTHLNFPTKINAMVLFFVFVMTFVLPALAATGMWFLKLIENLEMRQRHERTFPMIAIAVFFYITFYLLKQLSVFQAVTIFMLGSTMLVVLGLGFNYFYKISQHMIAWGGLTGALIALGLSLHSPFYFWLFGIIMVSGIMGFARLKTASHTPFEIYSGYLLGVLVMTGLFLYL